MCVRIHEQLGMVHTNQNSRYTYLDWRESKYSRYARAYMKNWAWCTTHKNGKNGWYTYRNWRKAQYRHLVDMAWVFCSHVHASSAPWKIYECGHVYLCTWCMFVWILIPLFSMRVFDNMYICIMKHTCWCVAVCILTYSHTCMNKHVFKLNAYTCTNKVHTERLRYETQFVTQSFKAKARARTATRRWYNDANTFEMCTFEAYHDDG